MLSGQNIDNKTWNERLIIAIEHRKKSSSNINNVTIAEAANITKSTLGYWIHDKPEKRVHRADSNAFLKVCKFLEINPFWVMFGEGTMGVRYGGSVALDSINDTPILGVTKYYKYERVCNYTLKNDKTFEPRVWENDVLFIDERQQKLQNGNLYLFYSDETGDHYVRRYFNDPIRKTYSLADGNTSERDTDSYSAAEFEKILKSMQIIGCVVGRYTEAL